VVQDIVKKDGSFGVWWGSIVECYSAFSRLISDSAVTRDEDARVRAVLSSLSEAWTKIEPSDDIRDITQRRLCNHPLRAANALQLAAAIIWSNKTPKGHHFVCLDARLRDAASNEGFTVLPMYL
jgi:predicted nucleic acid-binding protein